jgi:hypothetical protein
MLLLLLELFEIVLYRGADKFLARPTSQYILFDSENISFDANLVIYTHTHTHIYIVA